MYFFLNEYTVLSRNKLRKKIIMLWRSTEGNFLLGGHLAMSGYVFDYHTEGGIGTGT